MAPFKVLAVDANGGAGGGAGGGIDKVVSYDLAAHPFLSQAESSHLERSVSEALAEVRARREELQKFEKEIGEAAMRARQREAELAASTGRAANLEDAVATATAYGVVRRAELTRKLEEKEALASIATDAKSRWLEGVGAAKASNRRVVVFPVGDSLLEPFWPQVTD